MKILYLIIFFIFGLFFGSFFTVIGLRLPQKVSFVSGRSHCDKCAHELSFIDMIPVFSYLFLRGRCRYCKEKINPLSTYMEIFTGILFALAYYSFGFSLSLFIALGIVALLIIVTVSDMSYLVIPDEVLIFFTIYFIFFEFLDLGLKATFLKIISGVFLFLLMYLIMLVGNKVFKRESMGGGDIKMMFIFGVILHPLLGVISIFLGSCLALPVSLMILVKHKERIVPFGPFLLLALTLLYFTKITPQTILDILKF